MTHSSPDEGLGEAVEVCHSATSDRRSFLRLGGAGLAAATVLTLSGANHAAASVPGSADHSGGGQASKVRATRALVLRLYEAIESGSTEAIWAFFGPRGYVTFPFSGARYDNFVTFDAALRPFFAILQGLTFTNFVFESLADPEALIARYKGHAVIAYNGKSYDQTYVTEIHTRNGTVTSYAECFDTAVLNAALAP